MVYIWRQHGGDIQEVAYTVSQGFQALGPSGNWIFRSIVCVMIFEAVSLKTQNYDSWVRGVCFPVFGQRVMNFTPLWLFCLHESTTTTLRGENPELCRHYQPQIWSRSQARRDGQGTSQAVSQGPWGHTQPTVALETLKPVICLECNLVFLSLCLAHCYPHLSSHCCQYLQFSDK